MKRAVFALALACAACATPKPVTVAPERADRVVLLPSEQLSPWFVAQQKLLGTYQKREFSIEMVVQLAERKLTLIGLTPFGTRAFVLTQAGTDVQLQKFVDRELPFDPHYVLDDVHRLFFRKVPSAQGTGNFSVEDHGEVITERWSNGVLLERRFASAGDPGKSEVIITFHGQPSPVVAQRVTLDSRRFGYKLDIRTLTQQLVAFTQ